MTEKIRKENPTFYRTMDHLMLASYQNSTYHNERYVLHNQSIKVEVLPRAFYCYLESSQDAIPFKFKKSAVWKNDTLKCGFKLTGSTGKTYSYPALRDYIKNNNENDAILRASYFFACISQIIAFLSQENGDLGFEQVTL